MLFESVTQAIGILYILVCMGEPEHTLTYIGTLLTMSTKSLLLGCSQVRTIWAYKIFAGLNFRGLCIFAFLFLLMLSYVHITIYPLYTTPVLTDSTIEGLCEESLAKQKCHFKPFCMVFPTLLVWSFHSYCSSFLFMVCVNTCYLLMQLMSGIL